MNRLTFLKRRKHYSIHPTTPDDLAIVERLLEEAKRYYVALEWRKIQDFLGSPGLLLALDAHKRPAGLMLSVIGDGPVAWLRAVALIADDCLEPLLNSTLQVLQTLNVGAGAGLALLHGKGWLLSQLRKEQFKEIGQVVTFHSQDKWPTYPTIPEIEVQKATLENLEAILSIDHDAFPPLWWYDAEILSLALRKAFYFNLAHVGEEYTGYQFCTLYGNQGHIVRLATRARYQRRGIGRQLLNTALKALQEAGAKFVTVNTQKDNLASHHLYQSFNFRRVGKPWKVWLRSLDPVAKERHSG